jgi:hypothetical protein
LSTFLKLATLSPERGGLRNSNWTAWRRRGGSTFSILSSFFTRLWTWAACEARALKRSMKLQLLGKHCLLALELRLALPLAQRPLVLVEIEVAGICRERPAVDLDHPSGSGRTDPLLLGASTPTTGDCTTRGGGHRQDGERA